MGTHATAAAAAMPTAIKAAAPFFLYHCYEPSFLAINQLIAFVLLLDPQLPGHADIVLTEHMPADITFCPKFIFPIRAKGRKIFADR